MVVAQLSVINILVHCGEIKVVSGLTSRGGRQTLVGVVHKK